jgi:NADPH2:quinone reductase
VLKLEEIEKPRPGPGEALVRVAIAGVNFADTLLRRGLYIVKPQFPEIPGIEASGTVEEIGEGVDRGLIGRRVAFIGKHTYAEYGVADAATMILLPDNIGLEDGAAFPLQALTAYHLLFTMDRVGPGRTVLIHAAAGGVGLLLVQMAKLAGASVIGTTSSEEKAALVREYGADEVILYNQTDVAEAVDELTDGRGVDLVLDSVGKATFEGSLKSLAPFGHLVSYGIASGLPDPVNIGSLYEKSLKVSAFWLVTLYRTPDLAREGVERVVNWISEAKLCVLIGLKLPLAEAAEAHRQLEGRKTVGKVLLTV